MRVARYKTRNALRRLALGMAAAIAGPRYTVQVALLVIPAFVSFTPVGYGQDMPLFIAVHDLNGDGNLDLVTVPYESRPVSIAAHDLDGDGIPDLVTANSPALSGGLATITVLLGNGDGTFRPRLVEFPLDLDPLDTAEPQRIVVADFNGDGVDDLAVTEKARFTGRVAILLGVGGGDFEPPLTFSADRGAQALAAAELNGDGRLDLAVVNQGSNSISVLLGVGDGTFQRLAPDLNTPPCLPEGPFLDCRSPNAVIAADFDRDGQLDLAAASGTGNTVSIFRGRGDGQFDVGAQYEFSPGAEPVDLIAFDLNYDGVIDLASVNRFFPAVSVLIGNGDGTFQPGMDFPRDGSAIAIGDGDLNGVGMQDVLAGLNPSILSLLLGDPGSLLGEFTQLGGVLEEGAVRPAVVGDFNHDGGLDIARADVAGITVLLDPFVHPADFVEDDRSDPDQRDRNSLGRPLAPKAKGGGGGGGGGGPQPSFNQCSPTGYDCNILITLDRKGFLQVDSNPDMPFYPFPPSGWTDIGSLIGFQNDSRGLVHSLSINAKPGIPQEASWICTVASSNFSPVAPNVSILNIPNTANFAFPPWYFYNACPGGGTCPDRFYECDVAFDGGIPAGQSTYFSLHNFGGNYTGYFEVRIDLAIPWLSFQDLVVEGETADAILSLFPSDPASATLTLTTTAGTGSAVFADTNSTAKTINVSGTPVQIPIKGVEASSTSGNIRLQASVSGVTRELNFSVVRIDSVDVHSSDPETHKIASVAAGGKDHFVCVKDSGDIVLEAAVLPNETAAYDQLAWEADGAAITFPAVGSDKRTAKLSSSSPARVPVRIKVGESVLWEGVVWTVWASGSSSHRPLAVAVSVFGTTIEADWDFTWDIAPAQIITDADRPDLRGPNAPPPNGSKIHVLDGTPLSGGADKKWDESRQFQLKVINPYLYTKTQFPLVPGTFFDNQPVAEDLPDVYPSDPAEGNDDTFTEDEENDPYSPPAPGKLTGVDAPRFGMWATTGAPNETFETRFHFREFARIELGGVWYRMSDYLLWRVHYKFRKEGTGWVDNGSDQAADNNGF